jgi:toxin FitB
LGWILDTNLISETRRKAPHPRVVDWLKRQLLDDCFLSVVTLGEIEQGVAHAVNEVQAGKLREWLDWLSQQEHEGGVRYCWEMIGNPKPGGATSHAPAVS